MHLNDCIMHQSQVGRFSILNDVTYLDMPVVIYLHKKAKQLSISNRFSREEVVVYVALVLRKILRN